MDGRELHEIRRFLARAHAGLIRALAKSWLARRLVRLVHERHVLDDLLREEHLTRYGVCGGMAFAALDYYLHGWVLPQGDAPDDHPVLDGGPGRALRNYIWQGLLDSMQGRTAVVMLRWSLALHLLPNLGGRWVLTETKREWRALRRHLGAGDPWPIGLVGRANGSFANHQVLALGYDDPGDGAGGLKRLSGRERRHGFHRNAGQRANGWQKRLANRDGSRGRIGRCGLAHCPLTRASGGSERRQ